MQNESFYLILDILQRSKDVYFLILQVIIDPMVHYLNIQDIMNWNAVDALLFTTVMASCSN